MWLDGAPGLPGSAGAGLRVQTPAPLVVLPFDLFNYRPYVRAPMNGGKPMNVILDSGAAISGISRRAAQHLQVRVVGTAQLAGNGQSPVLSGFARNVGFELGLLHHQEPLVAVLPMEEIEAREGRRIDALLGVSFFKRYTVTIDYNNRLVSIFDPVALVPPAEGAVIVPLQLRQVPVLSAILSIPRIGPVQASLVVDSGTYSALRLFRPFCQSLQLAANIPCVPHVGFGVGGEFPEHLGRIDTLRLAGFTLSRPMTSFSQAQEGVTAASTFDGSIGGAILRRFTVSFQRAMTEMVLVQNTHFSEVFCHDLSGLLLAASGPTLEDISVRHVLPNSPASRSEVQTGDKLHCVNGINVSSLGLDSIRSYFCRPGDFQVQLERGSQRVERSLVLHDCL